ncbi:ABC transporter permease [Lutispora thermophila]|uniref:ABC-2 type transport system permease protein n=1 Tax=Lutispora thermophila DSM 19022 TaxID=1122184 RepID=A0A1M6H217_9FIRM|nr:ABC-2 family transporter protein [Lutispora thermophila]SHJ16241.1 ABC-2 type transport system permease protein [Lutispora thermophila DSM 19022]
MLTEVRKSLKLMLYYLKFNISSAMEYRTSFLIQCFGMMLNNSAFIFFWWILFNNVNTIGGYTFRDEMMLWAISSTSFGICFITFGNISNITRMILNGELDTYLLQPRDPLMNIVCSKTEVSAWGDTLYGIIMFFLIRGFDMKGFMLFLLFCVTGGLILACVRISFHALSFYSGNVEGLAHLVTDFLITFGIYPKGIFTGVVKFIIYTVIPTAFIVHIPAEIIMQFSIVRLLGVLAVTLLWIVIAYVMFYRGLKKYESGNLIISKL